MAKIGSVGKTQSFRAATSSTVLVFVEFGGAGQPACVDVEGDVGERTFARLVLQSTNAWDGSPLKEYKSNADGVPMVAVFNYAFARNQPVAVPEHIHTYPNAFYAVSGACHLVSTEPETNGMRLIYGGDGPRGIIESVDRLHIA